MHFLKHCKTAKEAVFLEQGFLLSVAAYKSWELFVDNCSVMPYSCLLGNLLSCHHPGRLDGISPPDTGPPEFIVLSLSLLWWYHSSPPGFTRKSAFKGTQVVCLQQTYSMQAYLYLTSPIALKCYQAPQYPPSFRVP